MDTLTRTYVIGDVHGQNATLGRLLKRIEEEAGETRLWFVGDLVNRGPDSLGVLRRVRDLGDRCVVVLGNHELRLLAHGLGAIADTPTANMREVLEAPDAADLLAWLRQQPVYWEENGTALVHASVWPWWSVQETRAAAESIHEALRGDNAVAFLEAYGRPAPDRNIAPLAWAAHIFTRARFVDAANRLPVRGASTPEDPPEHGTPWFTCIVPNPERDRFVFGHWAALGTRIGSHFAALDSGAGWNRRLTAYCLEDGSVLSENVR